MQFYEEHINRTRLAEFMRMGYPNTGQAAIIWVLMKVRLIQPSTDCFPLMRSISENLIEVDQVPQHAQSEVSSVFDQLADHGFVDPLLGSVICGNKKENLKLCGAHLLARHESGSCVSSVVLDFNDGKVQRRPDTISTYLNSESCTFTNNGRLTYDPAPGNVEVYHPDISFDELVTIHLQTVAELSSPYITIDNQDEMIYRVEEMWNRTTDYFIERGIYRAVSST